MVAMLDARHELLASFHHELAEQNLDELFPAKDYERLPESWHHLGSGQQRSLVTLFDVYSERLWDQHSPVMGVRSLTEAGWRRCVRDLFVAGPRLSPMVPINAAYGLYKNVATSRPASCPMPAFSKRECKEALQQPPPHVDFIGFVQLFCTVAEELRKRGVHPPSTEPANLNGALASMLHLVAAGAFHPDAEEKMEQRQVNRPMAWPGRPRVQLWDLLMADDEGDEHGASSPQATPKKAKAAAAPSESTETRHKQAAAAAARQGAIQTCRLRKVQADLAVSRAEVKGLQAELQKDMRAEARTVARARQAVATAIAVQEMHDEREGQFDATPVRGGYVTPPVVRGGRRDAANGQSPAGTQSSYDSDNSPMSVSATWHRMNRLRDERWREAEAKTRSVMDKRKARSTH